MESKKTNAEIFRLIIKEEGIEKLPCGCGKAVSCSQHGLIAPTETKPITIHIPRPDENGYCNRLCELYDDEHDLCFMSYEVNEYPFQYSKPGPGCPWYKEGR